MKIHTIPLTPVKDAASVKALLKVMNTNLEPVYVKSRPNQTDLQNECFPMVEKYVQENGGERILGWAISELPYLFIQAEFHAVWKSPSGELLDLNPRPLKTENILFLEDSNLVYDGCQKNSIHIPLTNHGVVRELIKVLDKHFEFTNRGERKNEYGELTVKDAEAIEYEGLMQKMMTIQIEMNKLYKPLGLYDPCICGSGKKAKWCHKLK